MEQPNALPQSEVMKSPEQLVLARRVAFHAAPKDRAMGIRTNGIFTNERDPNITENIGYSLGFPFERRYMWGNRFKPEKYTKLDVRKKVPTDYVLTVLDIGSKLKRTKIFELSSRRKLMKPVTVAPGKTQGIDEFSANHAFGKLGDPKILMNYLKAAHIRHLPAESVLATVPLSKPVWNEFLQSMVGAEAGTLSAEQIEANLLNVLKTTKGLFTKDGITLESLAHDLTASLEKNLIRFSVVADMERIKNPPSSVTVQHESVDGVWMNPYVALWRSMLYRSNVNDPVSATYLDKNIAFLTVVLHKNGVEIDEVRERFERNIKQLKTVGTYELSEDPNFRRGLWLLSSAGFFEGYPMEEAAKSVRQELEA